MVFKRKKILFSVTLAALLVAAAFFHAYAQSSTDTSTSSSDVGATNNADANAVSADAVPDDLSNGTGSYDTGPTADDINVSFSPQNPGAFQDVTITTDSDYLDLNRYNTSWFVDGTRVAEGVGQRKITFKTKGYGQQTSIVILVQLPDQVIKKTLSFKPQDMTLTWEAVDSYVPPFYQGKALLPREGIVKAVAIPNFSDGTGPQNDPTEDVYDWSRNENTDNDASGYGKDSYSFKNSNLRDSEDIGVTASNTDDSDEASQTITVNTYTPKILFYQKDDTTGITDPVAKTSIDLAANSSTIVAQPFFFSTIQNNPNPLTYDWTMNDTPITLADPNSNNSVDLQNPGGSGTATLGLDMSNPNSLFQSALAQLSISFNKN